MKFINKMGLTSLLLTLLMVMLLALPTMGMVAQSTVNLGTTSGFAVLAGSTITNTGTTIINGSVGGSVGLSPGTVFSGQTSTTISGSINLADAIAIQAKADLVIAYNDAEGRVPVTRIPTELGGTTLTPGTYDSADGTFQITGTLTLDAKGDPDGVFVFKTASTLITASSSNINLLNSARFCRTFWKVGSSATLGTNSHFVGHIFALQSITANTGASVQGQLLARNGAVTLDSNTITNGICDAAPAPTAVSTPAATAVATPVAIIVPTPAPTAVATPAAIIVPTPAPTPASAILHVIKHVINDNGRTAISSNFSLHVKTSGIDVATSPALGAESPGTTYTLVAGTYVVSEDTSTVYSSSYSGDSDSNGNITLAPGDNKTVTITNNDIASVVVKKPVVINVPIIVKNPVVVVLPVVTKKPVVVTPPVDVKKPVVTPTVTGGQLPKTSSNLYELLLIGAALILVGALGYRSRKRFE